MDLFTQLIFSSLALSDSFSLLEGLKSLIRILGGFGLGLLNSLDYLFLLSLLFIFLFILLGFFLFIFMLGLRILTKWMN